MARVWSLYHTRHLSHTRETLRIAGVCIYRVHWLQEIKIEDSSNPLLFYIKGRPSRTERSPCPAVKEAGRERSEQRCSNWPCSGALKALSEKAQGLDMSIDFLSKPHLSMSTNYQLILSNAGDIVALLARTRGI